MRNLHWHYIGQIYGGDFAKILGLLRKYGLSSAILRGWDGHIYNPMVSNKPIMTPVKHREHIYGGMKTREPIVILLKCL